jgi:hypothetical protein
VIGYQLYGQMKNYDILIAGKSSYELDELCGIYTKSKAGKQCWEHADFLNNNFTSNPAISPAAMQLTNLSQWFANVSPF